MVKPLISCLGNCLMTLLFFRKERRKPDVVPKLAFLVLFLTLPVYISRELSHMLLLSFGIKLACCMAYLLLGKERKAPEGFYLSLVYTNITMSMQILLPLLSSQIPGDEADIIRRILFWLVLFILYSVIPLYTKMDKLEEIRTSQLFVLLAISAILLYSKKFVEMDIFKNETRLYPAAIMALSNIAMVFNLKTHVTMQEREQQMLMDQKLKEQVHGMKAELDTAEEFKAIAHDIKNHLLLLKTEQPSDQGHHVDSLIMKLDSYSGIIPTGNSNADTLLSSKLPTIKALGIRLTVSMDLSGLSFLDEFDMVAILGNVIDNAIEATSKVPEENRYITMSSAIRAGSLFIAVSNSCLEAHDNSLKTTKLDKKHHGIGLKSIQRAVSKHKGELTMEFTLPDEFTLTIMLPLKI